MPGIDRLVFLKNVIESPLIDVGEYTYYDDPDDPEGFEKNVLYHFDFIGDRLKIGRFCQIASGATFIMNGGNHADSGISTFPFTVFGDGWNGEAGQPADFPFKGDTVVGNDVWIGARAVVMPGITIGDGAIVGSYSVVTRDVEPYCVVAGNPAREIRRRFDEASVEKLLEIAWWNWPPEKIAKAVPALMSGDIDALERI